MKSNILKTTLLAGIAVIAGAITSSAAAKTHKYTFVRAGADRLNTRLATIGESLPV